MRSRIDMVCPSYSNFSIGITLLHHNGSTVRWGGGEVYIAMYILMITVLACSLADTCFAND